MSEYLLAIALICQAPTQHYNKIEQQKKCVAEILKCVDSIEFRNKNKIAECINK